MPNTNKSNISTVNIDYQEDSGLYFRRIAHLRGVAWLDSGHRSDYGPSDQSRYDILTAEPSSKFTDPDITELQKLISSVSVDTAQCSDLRNLPFVGGLIGQINYESNHAAFALSPDKPSIKSNSVWHFYDWAVIQDHVQRRSTVVFLPTCTSKRQIELLNLLNNHAESPADANNFQISEFQFDLAAREYSQAFDKIKTYINAGDAYQINFAQRFSAHFRGNTATAYLALRNHLSGPYSAYFDTRTQQLLSFSPEQFIAINDQQAQTRPIKGTAPRASDPAEDGASAEALVESDKNRAENLMIVDLLRNDFSKNCDPHSVTVPKLFELESYKNVHHLVSTVTGKVKDGVEPLTFFMDCFPGGSITGAPKKRAMEIIAELEPHTRRAYCGSVAYLSAHGRMDSSITIRTLLAEENTIYCWGGGGIVADSEEHAEYEESIHKVKVLMDTLTKRFAKK